MPKKEVAKKQDTEIQTVDWERQMAAEAQAIAKTERPSANKIAFQSGVMTYMDNAIPDNTLDCIIIAHIKENVLYTERYKAGDVKPPACFAFGMPDDDAMHPHENVPEPFSDLCATCDNFKWGSDPEGGRGKACKERRRLAVIPNEDDPEKIKDTDMAVMSLPVMSIKNWANYVNLVSAKYQRPPWGMLTRVKLVPDQRSQFKVTFEAVESLPSEVLPHVHSRIEMATSALLTPYEMGPSEAAEPEEEKTKY